MSLSSPPRPGAHAAVEHLRSVLAVGLDSSSDRCVPIGSIPNRVSMGLAHRGPRWQPRHVGHRAAGHDREHPVRFDRGGRECVGPAGRAANGGEPIDREGVGDHDHVGHPVSDGPAGERVGHAVARAIDADEPQAGAGGGIVEPERLEPAARAAVRPQHRGPIGVPELRDPEPPTAGRRQPPVHQLLASVVRASDRFGHRQGRGGAELNDGAPHIGMSPVFSDTAIAQPYQADDARVDRLPVGASPMKSP